MSREGTARYALPTTGWVMLHITTLDGEQPGSVVTNFLPAETEDEAAEWFEGQVQQISKYAPSDVEHSMTLVYRSNADGSDDVTYLKVPSLRGTGAPLSSRR